MTIATCIVTLQLFFTTPAFIQKQTVDAFQSVQHQMLKNPLAMSNNTTLCAFSMAGWMEEILSASIEVAFYLQSSTRQCHD